METSHRSPSEFGSWRKEKINIEVNFYFWTKIEGKPIGSEERKTEKGEGSDDEKVPGVGSGAIQLGPKKAAIWLEEVPTATQLVD